MVGEGTSSTKAYIKISEEPLFKFLLINFLTNHGSEES